MRTLSATLGAAQKKSIGEPAAQVVIDDRHAGVFRPRWALLASDSVADGPSAMGMCYNGAIVRARSDPAIGNLYAQRITDAASVQQWTTWTLLETGVAGGSPLALAWDGNTIQSLFFVASDQRTIKARQSTDNGQSWGAAATVATLAAGHVCCALAASLNSGSGVLYCFYGDEELGVAQVYSTTRAESGGSWSTPQSWGRDGAALTGLAVDGVADEFRIVACLNRSLCTFTVEPDSLGAWPDAVEVLRSDSSVVAFSWPLIALNFDQNYYVFFVQAGGGDTRLHHLIAPDWDTISIFPRPYQMAAAYGVCSTADASYHYLCTSRYVYRAARWTGGASQRVEVGADVWALRLEERLDRPGRLVVTLRNDDGRYAAVGESGVYEAIKQGSQVSVRLGYRTSAGDEVSYCRPYWITGVAQARDVRDSRLPAACLLLSATDGWGLLDRAPARQGYAWTGQTVLSLLTTLLASFGFAVTDDGNDAWSRTVAGFAVNPGMALGDAVRYLLRLAGGCLIFRSDETWEEHWPSAIAHLLAPGGSSTYSFGGEHAIKAAEYVQTEQECTHVSAFGEGEVMGEALDWEMIELGNEDRLRQVVDRRLSTAEEAATRASEELARWQQAVRRGYLVVAPNVGQEIADVITIGDAAAGITGEERLVVGNTVTLDRAQGVFEQRLDVASTEC